MTGKEIKQKREALNLNQDQLAALIGVTKNTVYNYEKGSKIPESKITILNQVLNRNIVSLETVKNEKTPPEEVRFEDLIAQKVLNELLPKLKELEDKIDLIAETATRMDIGSERIKEKLEEAHQDIIKLK